MKLLLIIIALLLAGCASPKRMQAACDCYDLLPPNCFFAQVDIDGESQWALFCP